ncbi:MAG TPA: threonine/serine exporter family protein [Treponema sp.]|nr:threonine/serine exporter family protein [Treponema sp.]
MDKHRASTTVDEILDIALESGMLILKNGGETYRSEAAMISIASSLGARSASAFVTPTVVMLTCSDTSGQSHTRIQRVTERTINLGGIARVNELARRLRDKPTTRSLSQVAALLCRIRNASVSSSFWIILTTAFSCFCFSLLFRGSLLEAAFAFLLGALMRSVLFMIAPFSPSSFVSAVTGGAVISLFSGLAVSVGFLSSSGNVSIAVLMALVPGVAIVNAIRDIIAGDLVAGSARLLEAFVVAAALSIGAAFGLVLFPIEAAYTTAILVQPEMLPAFFLAFFAAGSFAYFYHSLRRDIVWAALFGAFGWIVYLLVINSTAEPAAGCFAGAACVGLCSELASRIFGKPATVYIIPGIIPLVPGGGMYETMLFSVWGDGVAASATGFATLSAAFAIATGLALVSSLFRLIDWRPLRA